jgi:hypothetical protein
MNEKPVDGETIILSAPGVHITPVRAVIGDQLFAVANITSVTVVKQAAGTTVPISCGLLGGIMLAVGALGIFTLLMPSARADANAALLGLSCTGGGAILLLISWYIYRTGKPRYVLVLRAGGGESQVYSSTNRVGIDAIAKALNDAIMARG